MVYAGCALLKFEAGQLLPLPIPTPPKPVKHLTGFPKRLKTALITPIPSNHPSSLSFLSTQLRCSSTWRERKNAEGTARPKLVHQGGSESKFPPPAPHLGTIFFLSHISPTSDPQCGSDLQLWLSKEEGQQRFLVAASTYRRKQRRSSVFKHLQK